MPITAVSIRKQFTRPDGLANHNPTFLFNRLVVNLFEPLQDLMSIAGPIERKDRLIGDFIEDFRRTVGNDLWSLIRLLLPKKDRTRAQFGVKEYRLGGMIVKMLGIVDKSAKHEERLLDYKNAEINLVGAGDFSNVVFEILKERESGSAGSELTIDDINNVLDELSKVERGSGKNKQGTQAEILDRAYRRMSSLEFKWFVRIILKDLKCAMWDSLVFDNFNNDAQHLYNLCCSLQEVIWTLGLPNSQLEENQRLITFGIPFKPQLSNRAGSNVYDLEKFMLKDRRQDIDWDRIDDPYYYTPSQFIIEEKIDGERCLLHASFSEDGSVKFKYFSRRGNEFTSYYGADKYSGSLTPAIHRAFDSRIKKVILDGEMLVWDPVHECFEPLGFLRRSSKEAFGSSDSRASHPTYVVFDIVFLETFDGHVIDFTRIALKDRKRALPLIFTPVERRIELNKTYKGNGAEDIGRGLENVIAKNGEGLIIKNPDSRYEINGRTTAWCKVKGLYVAELCSVKLVCIGTFNTVGASNDQDGYCSKFLFGLRTSEKDGEGFVYIPFAIVSDGFDFMTQMHLHAATNGKRVVLPEPPTWFKTTGPEQILPIQYIRPSESFIVKVRAAGIIRSDQFAAGYTLLLPRAVLYRERDIYDEEESTHIDELDSLLDLAKKSGFTINKATTSIRRPSKSSLNQRSQLFQGWNFLILLPLLDRGDVEQIAFRNGGSIYSGIPRFTNEVEKTKFVIISQIGHTPFPRSDLIENIKILRLEWIFDCLSSNGILNHGKYIFTANATNSAPVSTYTRLTNVKELKARIIEWSSTTTSTESASTRIPDPEPLENDSEDQLTDQESTSDELDYETLATTEVGSTINRLERSTDSRSILVEGGIETSLDDLERESAVAGNGVNMQIDSPTYYIPKTLFAGLVFYLDTESNAEFNNLERGSYFEYGALELADDEFDKLKKVLENGLID